MKFIYCLKNRLVNSWTDPEFDTVLPKDKARYSNNYCILKTEEALKQRLNEMDLYYFGEYDDEKGKFHLLEEPELLINLDQPFENLKKAQAALGLENGNAN